MSKSKGLPEVRRMNRVHIREEIYRRSPVTRTEISEVLGLTLPTVTTSVAEMLEEKLLIEEPLPDELYMSGPGGRRPLLLRFNPNWGYAVGVELGPYETSVSLVDINGHPVKEKIFPAAPEEYDEMLSFLIETLKPFLSEKKYILGVGVGIPGFIRPDVGVIRASSVRRSWNGRAVAEDLKTRLSVPVLTDNNVRMRAQGRALFYGKESPELFAYLFVSKGVACPIMIGGKVLSGSTFGAGELGHMVVHPDGPICPTCGRRGCLEAVAGETAILNDCISEMRFGRTPILAEICKDKIPDTGDILRAQQAGDKGVCAIVDRAVSFLGIAVANVVNLLSPAEVLVDGYLFRVKENQENLVQSAQTYLYGLNAQEVRIRFLDFNHFSGSRGATAAVINEFCIHGM